MKYFVCTDNDTSKDFDDLNEAQEVFERWKDDYMGDSVCAGESYVELHEYDEEKDDSKLIKKVLAVVDEAKMKINTPKEEGYEYDYWAEWQVIDC